MSTIVAIHQPNFFPWLGYFDKIIKSDIFVFMDGVQFPMTSRGTWMNRVKLLISGKPQWFSCPVKRDRGKIRINEVVIDETSAWRKKMLRTLECNYRKAPHYGRYAELCKDMISFPESNLTGFNIRNIKTICELLDIDTSKLILQSQLGTTEESTKLLAEITKKVHGDTYLCGGGADGYQEDDLFRREDLNLVYQNFQHPEYAQTNNIAFVAGLSILDCLLNIGAEGTKNILADHGHS